MKKIGMLLCALLIVSILADITKESAIKDGYVEREGIEKKLQLQWNIDGATENYIYELEVMPTAPTKEQADAYFEKAIVQIEQAFKEVQETVPVCKEYLDGIVRAKWSFLPYGLILEDGQINRKYFEEEEIIVEANVELTCGAYERIYTFSFLLEKPKLSVEEEISYQISNYLQQELQKEGSDKILLPTKIGDVQIDWSEKKDYVTPKIIFLEMISFVLLWMVEKRKEKEKEKKRIQAMEREYPDIVSQLALLLGAGMTIRQAWNRIGAQYMFKRRENLVEEKLVYEAILRLNRRFLEGESERVGYQKLAEEISTPCYYKLIRILLGNLEKGTQGMVVRLEEESRMAFEKRILLAKKLGEEASTKMMIPLMLMLMIVMGVVMIPALLGFQI